MIELYLHLVLNEMCYILIMTEIKKKRSNQLLSKIIKTSG